MTDLLIVGGGIMGLWAGVMAERAGLKTRIVERQSIGAGASGGLLGALMPHIPDRWDDKKQFQFASLVALEGEIAALEGETGLTAGYRRSGRLVPLARPHLRSIAQRHEQDALRNWQMDGRKFYWHVQDQAPAPGWPDASASEHGLVLDTLAARVAPRSLLAVLAAFLRRARHVRLEEGVEVIDLDAGHGTAMLSGGGTVTFDRCILAAGVQSFPMVDALESGSVRSSGAGVKGQAALLQADLDPSLPVIFSDGLYIVPHEGGHVAIGSTSEMDFADPFSNDALLDAVLSRAFAIAPSLRDAPVVERWAGLRPRAIGRDPMVGRHPELERIYALTGGFKISFGVAHRLASSVIDEILGRPDPLLPSSFRYATHLSSMRTA